MYKTDKNQNAYQPTFEQPVNTEPGTYAKFDGKALTVYQNSKEIYKFDAMSGKNEYQNPKYQNLANRGPIPEGVYVARQSEIQHITPYGLLAGIVNAALGGIFGSLIRFNTEGLDFVMTAMFVVIFMKV